MGDGCQETHVLRRQQRFKILDSYRTFLHMWLYELTCKSLGCLKQVTEHANFEEDLGLEKGDVVILLMGMLKKYGLSVSYVEARRMTTCAEVIDYIESQLCHDSYSSANEDHVDTPNL